MDLNQQPEHAAIEQSVQPVEWTWIAQRQATDGKASSIWKFGFLSPDGAEVRCTFHQVGQAGDVDKPETPQDPSMGAAPGAAPDQGAIPQPGIPNTDNTNDATFYITLFSNRNPDHFMKWDTSLPHEQSLVVWVTLTHGIVDFVRKATPANIILDDLANGKLKMIIRSVAMDIVASNPGYEIEQTQRHHYRTFIQVKKKGSMSAFADNVQGKSIEGETTQPTDTNTLQQSSPTDGNANPTTVPPTANGANPAPAQETPDGVAGKGQEPPDDQEQEKTPDAAFKSSQEVPIKQTPVNKKGLTVEIGKDYSVAIRDKDGNVIDRYRGKSPADILRWINAKGYGANRMKIVDREQPAIQLPTAQEAPERPAAPEPQYEDFMVTGKTIRMKVIPAKQAALMNTLVNADLVRCTAECVEFQFATDKDMPFKRALVELAFRRSQT